ncbi:MAG: NADH-quinone oxidoreductase subunit NuoK [archaeon]|nr:NADH-quinone oxidoreductase subunit NuoK [archaeon]
MIPMSLLLTFSALLFCIGLYGIITTEKGLVALMCIELMLNSANINFVTFSAYGPWSNGSDMVGQAFVIFSIAIAAAEVAVGIAIMLSAYKISGTNNTLELSTMRW